MELNKLTLHLAGVIFSLLGIFLGIWVLWPKKKEKVNYLEIKGNKKVSQDEILAAIGDLLKEEGPLSEKIEEVLLMNPRILSINFSKVKNGHYLLEIQEKNTLYLEHTPEGIREYAEDGQILQEQAEKSMVHFAESEIPIFYLTEKLDKVSLAATLKSDIMSLLQKTQKSHAFLWQRLSEIEMVAKKPLEEEGVELILYPVTVPAKIFVKMPLGMAFLERLWSILYYLEKYYPRTQTVVELYEQNAIIRSES